MTLRKWFSSTVWVLLLACLSSAQEPDAHLRITQNIDESRLTLLAGNTHPLARPQYDIAVSPLNLPLDRMILVLQRSPAQDSALKALIDQQQDKSSPNYHHWLTPDQFGQKFGPADQDIQTTTSWLQSHGFKINNVAKGRGTIEFSGTAAQVQAAFHTEIHRYDVNGDQRWANATDPEIPIALAPVVAGIASLHNFPRKPLHRIVAGFSRKSLEKIPTHNSNPLFTAGGACGLRGTPCYAVAPLDFATIYNLLPLWNASSPIDGSGQSIAIVAQSDIDPNDVAKFRSTFGLPAPNLNLIHNGLDPLTLVTEDDETETDLDVEWSGAVAKGATVNVVISATTNVTAGVDLSAEYIVDNDVAPIMSESYGACELELGTAGNQFYSQLWQQAAAEGISVFVAAGDSGSAGCDRNSPIADQGLAVNGIASTPYNAAVGGTDFNDTLNPNLYWSSTNNPTTEASALSYIPETTWNDSCTNSEYFPFTGDNSAETNCNDPNHTTPFMLMATGGGGGASNCTASTNQSPASCSGGYAKPSWQTGAGVPNDGKRDIPDVSLFAGDGLNANFYVICETDLFDDCSSDPFNVGAIGGTSASAPAFAGIMALINQKMGSRQGNPNYVFYPLAAQPEASCDSSGTLNSTCIFYDVTTGTIEMPCITGSQNCVTNTAGDQVGTLSAFNATSGYDLATGLGSVNVTNLVNDWSTVTFQPTLSTLTLSPTTQIAHGSPVSVNITVAPKSGTGIPTGLVSLLTSSGPVAGTFPLANGSVSATTGSLPGGSYTVTAHYSGDGTYGASDSSPAIPVTVTSEPSITKLSAFTLDQSGNAIPYTSGVYGQSVIYLRADVAGQSGHGVATGTVNLTQTENGVTTNFAGNPYALNNEGYTMAPLPGYFYLAYNAGTYSFNAGYSGDASFNPSSATPIGFTVTQAQTNANLTITGCDLPTGPCNITPGNQVTITATITGSFGVGNLPTGTVTFYSNGNPIGTGPVDSHIVPPIASLNTSSLPLGVDNLTAQYSGDLNYVGSGAPADQVRVGGTFIVTPNPSVIAIASPGKSGTTDLSFAAEGGLTGSTPLPSSNCSNLPAESTCSFSPSVLNFTTSNATPDITLTIKTTAPSSALGLARPTNQRPSVDSVIASTFCIAGICFIPVLMRRKNSLKTIAMLMILSSGISCGGGGTGTGGGGGGGGGGNDPGTPVGNYSGVTVTVTVSGFTRTVTLGVNVQ